MRQISDLLPLKDNFLLLILEIRNEICEFQVVITASEERYFCFFNYGLRLRWMAALFLHLLFKLSNHFLCPRRWQHGHLDTLHLATNLLNVSLQYFYFFPIVLHLPLLPSDLLSSLQCLFKKGQRVQLHLRGRSSVGNIW